MMKSFVFSACLLSLSASAFSATRIKCAQAPSEVPEGRVLSDYDRFFKENNIIPKTALTLNYVEQFKHEFSKFPKSLHKELMKEGAKIHIMEGAGVTVDPTWNPIHVKTFDGRPWSEVPGAGGTTAKEYMKAPTRIVINHLYDKQGSASMFLHEYGHNLDSIHSHHGISNSQTWADLLADEPNSISFLDDICGSYCTNNVEEGFAELLANYYACDESREQMEREVPKIAEFFRKFRSVKKLERIMSDNSSDEREDAVAETEVVHSPSTERPVYGPVRPEPRQDEERQRLLGCRRIFGRLVCI